MEIGKSFYEYKNEVNLAASYNSIKKEINDIKIYVFQPFKNIRQIKLKTNHHISILDGVYPANSIFIFNGHILDRKKTFSFYGICNENILVAIPTYLSNLKPNIVEKWRSETEDLEQFEKKINIQINKNSRYEMARIRDIKLCKYELSKKYFCSLKNNSLSKIDRNLKSDEKNKLKIDFDPINSPSSAPLPIIWT